MRLPLSDRARFLLEGEVLVVDVLGPRVTGYETDGLQFDVEQAAKQASWRLVLDLGRVTLLGSAGLSMLLRLNEAANSNGGKMVLCDVCGDIMGVLMATRLESLLNISLNRPAAITDALGK